MATSILAGDGIDIITSPDVTQVSDGEGGATVAYNKDGQRHSIEVDAILAASGRAPATSCLALCS